MDISSPVELAEIAAAPHRLLGVAIAVEGVGPEPAPRCARNPGVLYGLGNLIENAVGFAEKAVVIRASWTKSTVMIVIADDGPGFPASILARVGEPYLSQRDRTRRNEEAGGGLGLGLFIARSLLERSGATLKFANAAPPASGAVVTAEWPRSAYERGRRSGRLTCSWFTVRFVVTIGRMEKDAQQSSTQGPSGGETLDKSLLVVDDDKLFCERLARAMSSRGFTARTAISVAEALAAIETAPPAFAVIDLRLGDGSGLDVMRALKAKRADARGVILTGYGAIATAVMAVKLGAFDYLAKPANADDVVTALMAGRLDGPSEHDPPMSADRVRWEHIQRIYEACERNVSETARQLNMHRRTLQRILAKRAPGRPPSGRTEDDALSLRRRRVALTLWAQCGVWRPIIRL